MLFFEIAHYERPEIISCSVWSTLEYLVPTKFIAYVCM